MDTKEPKQRKDRGAKIKKGTPVKFPADATIATLARAIWSEQKSKAAGGKEKISKEQRIENWKKDQKEYKQLARRVVVRLTRRAGRKDKVRGGKAAAAGGAPS